MKLNETKKIKVIYKTKEYPATIRKTKDYYIIEFSPELFLPKEIVFSIE